MAYVNNGKERATSIDIITYQDGTVEESRITISALSAFNVVGVGDIPAISEDAYTKLSEGDFNNRINLFKTHINQLYATLNVVSDGSRCDNLTSCPLPASTPVNIIPQVRTDTAEFSEKDSYFLCPANTVMTGRRHWGDENANSAYEYSTLVAVDVNGNFVEGTITVEDVTWHPSFGENTGTLFKAPAGRVFVGRQHWGDEKGQTRYATAIVKYEGKQMQVKDSIQSPSIKESKSLWFRSDQSRVMTGRWHGGDENGQTYYITSKISSY